MSFFSSFETQAKNAFKKLAKQNLSTPYSLLETFIHLYRPNEYLVFGGFEFRIEIKQQSKVTEYEKKYEYTKTYCLEARKQGETNFTTLCNNFDVAGSSQPTKHDKIEMYNGKTCFTKITGSPRDSLLLIDPYLAYATSEEIKLNSLKTELIKSIFSNKSFFSRTDSYTFYKESSGNRFIIQASSNDNPQHRVDVVVYITDKKTLNDIRIDFIYDRIICINESLMYTNKGIENRAIILHTSLVNLYRGKSSVTGDTRKSHSKIMDLSVNSNFKKNETMLRGGRRSRGCSSSHRHSRRHSRRCSNGSSSRSSRSSRRR